ncbi:MAG: PilZ domain-containing protein [Paracoccaceae bacterium]
MLWRGVFAILWLFCLPVQSPAQSVPCGAESAQHTACSGAESPVRGWGFAEVAAATPTQNYVAPVPKAVLALNITWVLGLLICCFAMIIFIYARRHGRNRRRARRYYCQTHVTVEIDTDHQPATHHLATIVDISPVGARIVALPIEVEHQQVVLRFDKFSVGGKVLWVNEHFFCVDFNTSISRLQVQQVMRQPVSVHVPFVTKKGSARVGATFSRNS